MSQVIPLKESQAEILAGVLSRAFHEEPYFTYMVPDEAERRSVLPRLLASVIEVSRPIGESYTTPNVEGGAVWIRPEHSLMFPRLLETRLRSMNLGLTAFAAERCLILNERLGQVRRQLARKPHWYLVALGLDPLNEKRAIRNALLEPVLSRADSEGSYCYLETLQHQSLRFYEEHGFRIEGCGQISETGPAFWAMIRAPRRRVQKSV